MVARRPIPAPTPTLMTQDFAEVEPRVLAAAAKDQTLISDEGWPRGFQLNYRKTFMTEEEHQALGGIPEFLLRDRKPSKKRKKSNGA